MIEVKFPIELLEWAGPESVPADAYHGMEDVEIEEASNIKCMSKGLAYFLGGHLTVLKTKR